MNPHHGPEAFAHRCLLDARIGLQDALQMRFELIFGHAQIGQGLVDLLELAGLGFRGCGWCRLGSRLRLRYWLCLRLSRSRLALATQQLPDLAGIDAEVLGLLQ
ncbi:MAG: hypothetical protein ACOC0Q_08145, partial [Wenzhouxiangella sp.]